MPRVFVLSKKIETNNQNTYLWKILFFSVKIVNAICNMSRKYKRTTEYSGISGFYFYLLLRTLINLGGLDSKAKTVLDFGCGHGMLKKMLPDSKIINYDVVKELSDVDDWRKIKFDIMIINEVLYLFEEKEILQLLSEVKKVNGNVELVVGISRQSWLNNLGKIILGQRDAHDGTKTGPRDEARILKSQMHVLQHKSVLMLADVYRLKFK